MSTHTTLTVPTRFVEVDDIRLAYRRWGRPGGFPLVFMQYFSANLDDWDPLVTDGFAADYDVILFNNAGVASSGGETPSTVSEMTQHTVAFCDVLGLKEFNVVGFSLGGMIAQQLALDYPKRVRRIILQGTGPRGGEGMTFTELSAEERVDTDQFLLNALFSPSDESGGWTSVPETLGGAYSRSGSGGLKENSRGAAAGDSGMGDGAIE